MQLSPMQERRTERRDALDRNDVLNPIAYAVAVEPTIAAGDTVLAAEVAPADDPGGVPNELITYSG